MPPALKKGASKKKKQAVISETMKDLHAGPGHAKRTRNQEIAIAEKQAGNSRQPSAKTKPAMATSGNTATDANMFRKTKKRRPRNQGRH